MLHEEGHMLTGTVARSMVIAAVVELMIISATSAEMQVIESNVSEFQVGLHLKDVETLTLQPGGRVKVLLIPSGKTRVFTGPIEPGPYAPGGYTRGRR
jgi:hypothetical protein